MHLKIRSVSQLICFSFENERVLDDFNAYLSNFSVKRQVHYLNFSMTCAFFVYARKSCAVLEKNCALGLSWKKNPVKLTF